MLDASLRVKVMPMTMNDGRAVFAVSHAPVRQMATPTAPELK